MKLGEQDQALFVICGRCGADDVRLEKVVGVEYLKCHCCGARMRVE